LGTRV